MQNVLVLVWVYVYMNLNNVDRYFEAQLGLPRYYIWYMYVYRHTHTHTHTHTCIYLWNMCNINLHIYIYIYILWWAVSVSRAFSAGPIKKINCVKNIFIDYLGMLFICVMSTTLPMISLVEAELDCPFRQGFPRYESKIQWKENDSRSHRRLYTRSCCDLIKQFADKRESLRKEDLNWYNW